MDHLITTIALVDGRGALNFAPNLNEGQELAVVDVEVLKYLVGLLPQAKISVIINEFSIKAGEVKNVQGWCELLQSELSFHMSVNMLQQHLLTKPEPAVRETY